MAEAKAYFLLNPCALSVTFTDGWARRDRIRSGRLPRSFRQDAHVLAVEVGLDTEVHYRRLDAQGNWHDEQQTIPGRPSDCGERG